MATHASGRPRGNVLPPPALRLSSRAPNRASPARNTDLLRNEILALLRRHSKQGIDVLSLTTALHEKGFWGRGRPLNENLKRTISRNLIAMEKSKLFGVMRRRSKAYVEADRWSAPAGEANGEQAFTLSEAFSLLLIAEQARDILPDAILDRVEGFLLQAENRIEAEVHDAGRAQRSWRSDVRSVPRFLRQVPAPLKESVLKEVMGAIVHDRLLRITYRSQADARSQPTTNGRSREVEPYGLIQRGSTTYLVAQEVGSGKETRMYALQRMSSATMTNKPIGEKREDIDEFIRQGRHLPGPNRRIRMKARVSRELQQVLAETPLVPGMPIKPDGDGFLIEASLLHNLELVQWILGHGSAIEVIEPAALREDIRRHVEGMWKAYVVRHD